MSEVFEIVPFHQHQIMTVKTDSAVFVVMKPIVEALGLDWRAQQRRIAGHPVIAQGMALMTIPSAGGMQETLTLDLEQFHGWLITLTPERVKDGAKRDVILCYQAEAFRVVFEHFHGKIGSQRTTRKSTAASIALQNHYLSLGNRLRNTADPAERKMIYSLLEDVGSQIGQTPPALEEIGSDRPRTPEILEKFWHSFALANAHGHRLNQARKENLIAVNLKEAQQAFDAEGIDLFIGADMHRALRQSAEPLFIATRNVNCRDGKVRACWVFRKHTRH